MFKVGQKVVIKKSEQRLYRAPYDGVVKKVADDACIVEFSDGGELWMLKRFLEAAEAPQPLAKILPLGFKVDDKVVIKPSERWSVCAPYDGVVVSCAPNRYLVKFSDGEEVEVSEDLLIRDAECEQYECDYMAELLRSRGYLVEKI